MSQSRTASEDELRCSYCKETVEARWKYCPNCGHCPSCGGSKGLGGNPANEVSWVPSTKVAASSLGAAFATIIWFFIGMYWLPEGTDAGKVATAAGATGTVITFALGYLVPDPRRK